MIGSHIGSECVVDQRACRPWTIFQYSGRQHSGPRIETENGIVLFSVKVSSPLWKYQ